MRLGGDHLLVPPQQGEDVCDDDDSVLFFASTRLEKGQTPFMFTEDPVHHDPAVLHNNFIVSSA